MLNLIALAFATFMASMDVVVLGWLKEFSMGKISWKYIPVGMLIYGLQPLLFLQSLKYESMTVMNILWDLTSDLIVTATGLFYFKEKLTTVKKLALALAFVAIMLFACDETVCSD
jgi:multidrug transporter EmrE-like cation transporter